MKKETYNSGSYKCPFCGYKGYLNLSLRNGDKIKTECPNCGKKIEITVEADVYYKTRGLCDELES